MSSETLYSCISSPETGQVSVGTSATLLVNATIGKDPTATYPIRRRLLLCNTGTKSVFIGIGFQPTTSNYSYMLVPSTGTIDTFPGYTAPGTSLEDVAVHQDAIYGITSSSTTTVNVTVGV